MIPLQFEVIEHKFEVTEHRFEMIILKLVGKNLTPIDTWTKEVLNDHITSSIEKHFTVSRILVYSITTNNGFSIKTFLRDWNFYKESILWNLVKNTNKHLEIFRSLNRFYKSFKRSHRHEKLFGPILKLFNTSLKLSYQILFREKYI